METYLIAVDTSKHYFQAHGVTRDGRKTFERKLKRTEFERFIEQYCECRVAMEVGSGCHYWGRRFRDRGHKVLLIPAAFVKPYVKSQKNDRADAEAIAEAALRPGMRFVPVKNVESQDLQNLHRVRERLVTARTALVNQIRGLLAEYGIVVPQGVAKLRSAIPEILAGADETLSSLTLMLFQSLQKELGSYDDRITELDRQLKAYSESHPVCQRLKEVPGIGPLTSTALVAAATAPHEFKNGRQFAAWLGLVPKQHSTGGKTVLGGISKRGNPYLRKLLIHGARAVVSRASKKTDDRNLWVAEVKKRRGLLKAAVALANKNARVVWTLLTKLDEHYRETFVRLTAQKQAA